MKKLARFVSAMLIMALMIGCVSMFASAANTTFTDVKSSDWFYNDVTFVAKEGIMNGTSKDKFDPSGTATRAMIATIFWRLEGAPKPAAPSGFSDVPAGQWYADAIAWMKDKNITNGTGPNTFSPNGAVTREELATFLYRFAKAQGRDIALTDTHAYDDQAEINKWAVEAIAWAKATGIMSGNGTMFIPKNNANRAEIAATIARYVSPAICGVEKIAVTNVEEKSIFAGDNLPDIEVTVYMKDGSARVLEPYNYVFAPVDLDKPGKVEVKVFYLGYFTATFSIEIMARPDYEAYDLDAAMEYGREIIADFGSEEVSVPAYYSIAPATSANVADGAAVIIAYENEGETLVLNKLGTSASKNEATLSSIEVKDGKVEASALTNVIWNLYDEGSQKWTLEKKLENKLYTLRRSAAGLYMVNSNGDEFTIEDSKLVYNGETLVYKDGTLCFSDKTDAAATVYVLTYHAAEVIHTEGVTVDPALELDGEGTESYNVAIISKSDADAKGGQAFLLQQISSSLEEFLQTAEVNFEESELNVVVKDDTNQNQLLVYVVWYTNNNF